MTNKQGQLILKNLTYDELEQWCIAMGEPPTSETPLHIVTQYAGCAFYAW